MIKKLSIVTHPNESLRVKSRPLDRAEHAGGKLNAFSQEMINIMLAEDGVGLAAPQVGKNIRLIAVNTKDGPITMINPVITGRSWRREWGEEGCLSVPGIYGSVKRHHKIAFTYVSPAGENVKLTVSGFFARVIQHEIDHLDGVLFIDKARDLYRPATDGAALSDGEK